MRWLNVLVLVVALFACATVRPAIKTAYDIAMAACVGFAERASSQELRGLSAEDWCGVAQNLQPFLDHLLAAQEKAGLSDGVAK